MNSYIIFSGLKPLSRMGSDAYLHVNNDKKNDKLDHLLKMRVTGK